MRVVIAGSRGFHDYKLLSEEIDKFMMQNGLNTITVVSGGARGADTLGEKYAEENEFPVKKFIAEWRKNGQYNKRAGYERNELMAKYADACIVFWDGESKGTNHMQELAKENNLILKIVKFEPKYEFFFGQYSSFSNWHKVDFIVDGVKFNCMEQYIMYRKAKMFRADDIAKKIMSTPYDPKAYKTLGREIEDFDQAEWDEAIHEIAFSGLMGKFTDNLMMNKLLDTGNKILAEANPYDKIWGIGMSIDDDNLMDESAWGENILGKTLMEVREVLRSE